MEKKGRVFLLLSVLLIVLLAIIAAVARPKAPALPPETRNESADYSCPNCSVVMILIDALRYDHLGCYGYGENTSPNIDVLCSRSLVFDNAIPQGSWTKPSFTSLFTSRYAQQHNVTASKGFSVGGLISLPASELTLAEVFLADGYRTKAIFSPNMPSQNFYGLAQGFEEYYATHPGEDPRVTNDGIEWMEERRDGEPFFLFLHYLSPHYPYNPPPGYAEMFGATNASPIDFATATPYTLMNMTLTDDDVMDVVAHYDGQVFATDEQVGRVMDYLESSGKRNSTIVVILSDHGENLGALFGSDPASQDENLAQVVAENFQIYTADPARMRIFGHIFMSKKVVQVPLIVSPPSLQRERRYKGIVELIDVGSTILKMAGLSVPSAFEGLDLIDFFSGKARRDYGFTEVLWADGNKTVGIRTERFLFAKSTKSGRARLYEMAEPRRIDVSGLYPDYIAEFNRQFDAYMHQVPLANIQDISAEEDVEKVKDEGYIR